MVKTTNPAGYVLKNKHTKKYVLILKKNEDGYFLLDADMEHYKTDREHLSKMFSAVKKCEVYSYRGKSYIDTRQGLISCASFKVMSEVFTRRVKANNENNNNNQND